MSSFLVIFFVLLLTFVLKCFRERLKHFRLFSELGIPGPRPSFFWGNFRQLHSDPGGQNALDIMTKWESEYGLIYGYFSGSKPMLVIKCMDLISEILQKSEDFIDRPKMLVDMKPLSHTLVGLRGQRWKQVRQLLSPIFSQSKVRSIAPVIYQSVQKTLKILENCQDHEILSLSQGLTCEIICESALAMKVESQVDLSDSFLRNLRQFFAFTSSSFVVWAICWPTLVWTLQKFVSIFRISSGQMTNLVCESVEKAIKDRTCGSIDRPPRDILQYMLDLNEPSNNEINYNNGSSTDKETSKDTLRKTNGCVWSTGPKLSIEEIVANAWIILIGGYETTSNALSFTLYLLASNLDQQDKLHEQIQLNLPEQNGDIPTVEQISKIKILDQIISESLRIYPPVVNFITRELASDRQIGPFWVPKGISVLLPLWQIHHDPKLWPNPEKFDPERFSNPQNIHPMTWLPFGGGQRKCIGINLALLELKLTLVMIIRKFRILPCTPCQEKEFKLSMPTVTLHPVNGIHLKCIKRV